MLPHCLNAALCFIDINNVAPCKCIDYWSVCDFRLIAIDRYMLCFVVVVFLSGDVLQ